MGSDSFLILFVLFILALEFNERDSLNVWEVVFMVYALGFSLEKIAAMQEHGIKGTRFRQFVKSGVQWSFCFQSTPRAHGYVPARFNLFLLTSV